MGIRLSNEIFDSADESALLNTDSECGQVYDNRQTFLLRDSTCSLCNSN